MPAIIGEFIAERDIAAMVIAQDDFSTEQRVNLLTLSGRLKVNLDGLRADLAGAFRNDGRLAEQIAGPLTVFVKSADGFTLNLDEALIERNGKNVDGQRIKQNYATAIRAADELWAKAATELDRLVAARIARFKATLAITLSIV